MGKVNRSRVGKHARPSREDGFGVKRKAIVEIDGKSSVNDTSTSGDPAIRPDSSVDDSVDGSATTGLTSEIHRLRLWQIQTRKLPPAVSGINGALLRLNGIATAIDLPSEARLVASQILQSASEHNLVVGRSMNGIIGAAICMACRLAATPRPLIEIANVSGVAEKTLAGCFRMLADELGLLFPVPDPTLYASVIISRLGFSTQVQAEVARILEDAEKQNLVAGRDPWGLAASAVYAASLLVGSPVSQKDVGRCVGVSEVTVRNRYKELAERVRGLGSESDER